MKKENQDSFLINPEEIRKQKQADYLKQNEEEAQENAELFRGIDENPVYLGKYQNTGGLAKINYESQGRFSIPPVLHFEDYSTKQVNDLILSREEQMLETLLNVLQENCSDPDVDLGELTLEEFFETIVGIKLNFNKKECREHSHMWVCDCQASIGENDRKTNEEVLDLLGNKENPGIKFRNITECDEDLRKMYGPLLKALTKDEFQAYLEKKYGAAYEEHRTNSVDDEIRAMEFREPITFPDSSGSTYKMRWQRIKDLLLATELANKKWDKKIAVIRQRQEHGVPGEELKAKKEQEIKKINELKAKDVFLFAKALRLTEKDGKVLNNQEKIQVFSDLKEDALNHILDLEQDIDFGIFDEREFVCSICGKVERGWLQQRISPMEFIPIRNNKRDDSKTRLRKPTELRFYFGV